MTEKEEEMRDKKITRVRLKGAEIKWREWGIEKCLTSYDYDGQTVYIFIILVHFVST